MIATSPNCRSTTDSQCPDCHNYWDSLAYPGMPLDPIIICPNCAEMHNKIVCEDCAKKFDWVKCEECNDWYEKTDLVNCGGDMVCVNCAHESNYSCCEGCNEWFEGNEIVDCGNSFYCEHCAENHGWSKCEECCKWHSDSITSDNNETFCSDCYYDRYSRCEHCNNEISSDDSCYDEEIECVLCQSCYDYRDGSEEWEPEHFINRTGDFGSTRRFGIELETHCCSDHAGFRGHAAWGAKHDDSISGKEFVSAILYGNGGLKEIDDLCSYANDNGWTVNRNCGFHLHIDVSDKSTESKVAIVGMAIATYSVWKKFVSEYRHYNHYCNETTYNLSHLLNSGIPTYHTRFAWFNVEAYKLHGTFEVRLHEGTLDATTIKMWVKSWTILADWAATKTIQQICNEFYKLSITGIFHKMCQIWKDAGCNDLVTYYSEKGKFNPPASFEDKIQEIRELSMARGV